MGVKTLDPSDYALVSSVTKHLSGVQLLNTENLRGFGHVRLGFRLLTYILCLRACLAAKQPPLRMPAHPRRRSLSSPRPLTLPAKGAACGPGLVLGLGAWNRGDRGPDSSIYRSF